MKNDLTNEQIVQAIGEIQAKIKEAEPKVDMIFLETTMLTNSSVKEIMPTHIG